MNGKRIRFECDELQGEADVVTLVLAYQLRSKPIITYKLRPFRSLANAIERSRFVGVVGFHIVLIREGTFFS